MGFEIEKVKDGTFTSREVVSGKITRSNSGVNTTQAAYKNIIGWIKRDGKSLKVNIRKAVKTKNKPQLEFNCEKDGGIWTVFVNIKEINC